MAQASYTVTIARPIADVFAYVADGERCPEWRPSVIDIGRASGEGLGAIYEQGVRGPKGRRIAADYEITVYDPNRRIEFQTVAGPVRPHGVYEFAEADGGTRLTFSLDAKLSGLTRPVHGVGGAADHGLGGAHARHPQAGARNPAAAIADPGFDRSPTLTRQ